MCDGRSRFKSGASSAIFFLSGWGGYDSIYSVFCFLDCSHFAQAPQVPLGGAQPRREKGLNEVPGDRWANGSATQAD